MAGFNKNITYFRRNFSSSNLLSSSSLLRLSLSSSSFKSLSHSFFFGAYERPNLSLTGEGGLLDRLLYCLGSFINFGVLLLDLFLLFRSLFRDGDLVDVGERGDLDRLFLDFLGDLDRFFLGGDLLLE